MIAHEITTASLRLKAFALRSKLYAYFFLCMSTTYILASSILNGVYSINTILSGVCITLIPIAIYFAAALVEKISSKILKCQVSSVDEFDCSLKGPFSGMSWPILWVTFFLACTEVLIDYALTRSFGMYGPLLVTFTTAWVIGFYLHFNGLKKAIRSLKKQVEKLDPRDFPTKTRVLIEEAQRGNIETLVDKREDLTSL